MTRQGRNKDHFFKFSIPRGKKKRFCLCQQIPGLESQIDEVRPGLTGDHHGKEQRASQEYSLDCPWDVGVILKMKSLLLKDPRHLGKLCLM